ncbi:MAG TPA: C13 family peptidase [Gammaproteobacteria bacterium]|nr:C13 family peptidase [Gammaproteobacteria bacterium]
MASMHTPGYFVREARALRANLLQGLRLTAGRHCDMEAVQAGVDQIVWLVAASLAADFVISLSASLPHPQFNTWGASHHALGLMFLLFAAYLIGKRLAAPYSIARFVVMMYASGFWLFLLWSGTDELLDLVNAGRTSRWVVYIGFMAWGALVALHILSLPGRARPWRRAQAFAIYLAMYLGPLFLFSHGATFWYPAPDHHRGPDRWATYRHMDAESLMYAQPQLLDKTLARLAPQRRGVADMYFVGFAGYARQDVFRKEVEYTRRLFDKRFDTRGRSVMLINSLKTRKRVPLATATNLKRTLARIGKTMDPDHDVLVLFMTSHGGHRPPELDVDFWPLALNQVTPARLKRDLDAAGIKWRLLIVSSCYSGGFVKPLETPYTLITTAAAADRTSFGCSNDNDFTYFGEAFIRDQLTHTYSFVDAYGKAAAAIHAREGREHLRPSEPQLFVGRKMLDKLGSLQRTLLAHACRSASKNSC